MDSSNNPQTAYPLLIEERRLAFQNVEPGGSPVEAFLNAWPHLEPHYRTMVDQLKSALESALEVRCTVSARVKALSSIEKSIRRRQNHRGERYKEVDEIFDDLHDLAGFRIVVDYPSGIGAAKAFITQNFQLKSTNIFKADREVNEAWKPTFGSFQSENHHVVLHSDAKYPLSPFCGILFEVQVLSLAESLYNRLAHPLLYKKSSGELPVKDQKMIDVSHGLALCYWICLSCMEDRLEGTKTETIPSPIQEVARLDGNQNTNMELFVRATPYSMPASDGEIPIEKCRESIENFRTQAMSSDQLYDRLSAMLKVSTQDCNSNVNSGTGHNMQNNGSGNNMYYAGGNMTTGSGNNMYNAGGNISIGKEDIDDEIKKAFWVTDPQLHKEAIEERKGGLIEDSYRWILHNERFTQWYENDAPLLWLNGDPGKGKTMSACGIINHINLLESSASQGSNPCLAYFFCEASDSHFNNATSVLRGLIYSIISQNSMALSYVRERYKELSMPLSDPRLAWYVLQRTFVGILGANTDRKTCLIIDALDECRDDRDKLLEFIVRQSSLLPVKWLISSRKWPSIREVLMTCPVLVELCLEDNETDISAAVGLYITHQVKSLSDIKRYSQDRKEEIELRLRSKSNDTFLWVSLVCRMLKQIPSWQAMKRLDSLPSGLDELYGRMLEQIQPTNGQEREPSFDKLYAQIVSFALGALRPLSVDELYCLLDDEDITVTELQEIVALCGSFLTVQHQAVYFIHDSAKTYLTGEKSGFQFDLQQQHAILFSQSLINLSRSLHRDMLGQESHQPRKAQNALDSISYQCIHWVLHLAECKPETLAQQSMDGSLVDDFLRQKFLFWVETLGHLNSVGLGISALLKLNQIIYNHISPLKDLVQDELRYIRYHRSGIEQRPLQVYPLLQFSPIHCTTRKVYASEAPDWFTLTKGIDDYWSPCVLTMEGHTDLIRSVVFSHDGRFLASASDDTTVKIWDVLTGTCLHTLHGQNDGITKLAFSRNNHDLASGYGDKTINIWDANNGVLVRTLHGHSCPVSALTFSKHEGVLASGSRNGTIKLFDTLSGVCTRTIVTGDKRIDSIVFTHNDQMLSCGIEDSVLIWDLHTRTAPYRLDQDEFTFVSKSLASSDTEDLIFLCTPCDDPEAISPLRDYQVEIWNPMTRVHTQTTQYPVFNQWDRPIEMESVIFSRDGTLLAATTFLDIGILNPSTLQWKQPIGGGSITGSVSPKSDILAVAPVSTIQLWDLSTIHDWTHPSQRALFSPVVSDDGSLIAIEVGEEEEEEGQRELVVWQSCTGRSIFSFTPWDSEYPPIFSPDGQMLILHFHDEIHIRQTFQKNIKQRVSSPFDNNGIGTVAFSHDNRWLAVTSSRGQYIRIWDVATEQFNTSIAELTVGSAYPFGPSKMLSFSHDCRRLAVYDQECIGLYETDTLICKWRISDTDRYTGIQKAIFSSDDKWLAVASSKGFRVTTLDIWNLETRTIYTSASYPSYEFRLVSLHASTPFRLENDLGTFEVVDDTIKPLALPKYSISEDVQWILQGTKRLLWLPPDFRPPHTNRDTVRFCKSCLKFKVTFVTSAKRMVSLVLP
ncbi:hypothetical protein FAUST_4205 [Fusarium austroamericanum]|uniref:NACHT domain-containing protein n=1 Tax=Fusarium austroamericanum TaxID=282268 RepID=A0AAN6HGW3_FUSAU|nr:hypothetical protein FAUST_4205 [Fusarium austroamericanum]